MGRFIKLAAAATALLASFGCTTNYYNVKKENFQQKVRTLGVAPVFVDAESDIRHPQKDELVAVTREITRKNDRRLVEGIRETGAFYAVRPLEVDADELFADLVSRRERRDDAGIIYNKYFFKPDSLRKTITDANVDALLLVVVSGVTRGEKVFASNLVRYLDAEYNHLIITAQIIDSDGMVLWEYPNFRQRLISLPSLVSLQYPDFDEADANLAEQVDVKFRTVAGIRRALEQKQKDYLFKDTAYSRLYASIYSDMTGMLKPEGGLLAKKEKKTETAVK